MTLIKVEDSKYINLENVANINFVKDKIVFNMAYSVEKADNGRISDYFYTTKMNDYFRKTDYFNDNFIQIVGKDREVALNKNKISYIKKDSRYCKIIIGFTHDVNISNLDNLVTVAEHYYIKMDNNEDLDDKFSLLIQELNM